MVGADGRIVVDFADFGIANSSKNYQAGKKITIGVGYLDPITRAYQETGTDSSYVVIFHDVPVIEAGFIKPPQAVKDILIKLPYWMIPNRWRNYNHDHWRMKISLTPAEYELFQSKQTPNHKFVAY